MMKEKSIFSIYCVLLFVALANVMGDHTTRLIDIPPRAQWTNRNGYCGSCSIQMAALYYGMYVSQDMVRKTVGDKEILLGVNATDALDALSLEYQSWDASDHRMSSYCQWLIDGIHEDYPAIFTVKVQGEGDPEYDHIMLAVGYHAENLSNFSDSDTLIYNDCFEKSHFYQSFGDILNNGQYYYLQSYWHYGICVTGIRDDDSVCLPIRISLDQWEEPNVTQGESPERFQAVIHIDSLQVGLSYALFRYSDWQTLPATDFSDSDADTVIHFIAQDTTMIWNDVFDSDGIAIYRCVPDVKTSITKEHRTSEVLKIDNFPNPFNAITAIQYHVPKQERVILKIYDAMGRKSRTLTDDIREAGKYEVPWDGKSDTGMSLSTGLYMIKLKIGNQVSIKKMLMMK